MSVRQRFIMGAAVLALAACGEKAKEVTDKADAEVPSVEEVEKIVQLTDEEAIKRSEEFLAKNAKAKGVTVTESGLQYKSLKDGDGPEVSETDMVVVHYTGKRMDGTIFDTSQDRGEPVNVTLNRVVKGWKEGMLLMRKGGKAEITMPSALAYGPRGTGDGTIGPNQAISFDVELIEVVAQDDLPGLQRIQQKARGRYTEANEEAIRAFQEMSEPNIAVARAFLIANQGKEGVQSTASGLQYEVLERGAGEISPAATDLVEVHYRGTLINGTEFDSSYSRKRTETFPLNRVIAGWTEGVQLMREGDKFRFFVPPGLAYGANQPGGVIGPNELLFFDVELVDVKDPVTSEAVTE